MFRRGGEQLLRPWDFLENECSFGRRQASLAVVVRPSWPGRHIALDQYLFPETVIFEVGLEVERLPELVTVVGCLHGGCRILDRQGRSIGFWPVGCQQVEHLCFQCGSGRGVPGGDGCIGLGEM